MSHPEISEVIIEAHPPAERLRLKGQRMRYARDGQAWDYRVVKVSMPDEWGRCVLTVEPDGPPPSSPAGSA